jgi:hypothetical protein
VLYRRRDCRPDRLSPVPVRSASMKRLRTNLDRPLSVCITASESSRFIAITGRCPLSETMRRNGWWQS